MQLLKCLETVRKCPLDKAGLCKIQLILELLTIRASCIFPSGFPEVKIFSNHELVNELFSKVD